MHETTTQDPETLFRAATDFLRSRSPQTFDPWFAGVQFESLTDGVLALRARDEFIRAWVDEHFLPTLTDFLRSETGWSIQVAWSVGGELERPIVSRPYEPPVRPRPLTLRPSSPSAPPSSDHGSATSPALSADAERSPDSFRSPVSVVPAAPVTPAPLEGLNAKYTFANFVIGPSNQLAHAAAMGAAGGAGPRHNPLFLCGGTGLGKTHLVHAVAHRVREERPETRILYVSAEKFVNEFVQSLQDQKMAEFRARYRERCDLLLVDDIQFLANKTQTQEEFFHAFNALHQADKQIIVTSDKYPQQLERMEERLISRFTWGLVADIQGPELETRVAILRKKAQMEKIDLEPEVVLFLAQSDPQQRARARRHAHPPGRQVVAPGQAHRHRLRARRDRRLQRGASERDQRRRHPAGRLPSLQAEGARPVVQGPAQERRLRAARRDVPVQAAAQVQLPRARDGPSGGRDHTTVMSAVRKVADLRDADPETRAHLEALERKLGTSE